jgi:4-amino-4-deoxy-L-arabinose transferase-like glycosyltransferase
MTASDRSPGLREALVIGGLAVVVVLLAASVTFLLPPDVGALVFRTPLLILVLVVGTVVVLWRITRPGR